MSNLMIPPPEYRTPPIPDYARYPVYNQRPRPSSHRWLWITLGTVVLVCIIGGALLVGFAASSVGGPTIASDQYYTALRDQDYARAYSFLGSELKAAYSQGTFTQMAQQRDAADGRVTRYSYQNIPVGSPTPVVLTVARAGGATYTVHLEMQQEGGAWVISAFDRI